jgi:GT2 family glycosyltransferase
MTFHFRLLRRSIYDRIGGIDTHFIRAFDYDLCLKLSEVTAIEHYSKALYYYRLHQGNTNVNKRLAEIEWSKKAVESAIVRRGLENQYELEIDITSIFRLNPKKKSIGRGDR